MVVVHYVAGFHEVISIAEPRLSFTGTTYYCSLVSLNRRMADRVEAAAVVE